MELAEITEPVKADFDKVNKLIIENLYSQVPLINEIGNYLIQAGGKRLRPLLVLLCARACGYREDAHLALAVAIEFIHNATLLHDDVIDTAALRRGRETSNNVWGNEAAVLVGDFLYSRAFQLMVNSGNHAVLKIIADATNAIAEGEVLQLQSQHNPATTESEYFTIIGNKTARLFAAGAEIGAVLTGCSPELCQTVAQYGFHLGNAFQLIDDLLDYQFAPQSELGKNIGNDLAEGKPTLPIIYLLQHGSVAERQLIADAINSGSIEQLPAIQTAIANSNAHSYTLQLAQQQAMLAKQNIAELPRSEFQDAAINLIDFIITRRY